MLRHVIAPAHSFAQIPNSILRHPRLSSDAKNLLNWQLSLPPNANQCLSETASKAKIKKTAFQRAKVQLLDEGYLHQWRRQVDGGLFVTDQLISNTPLNAKEALAVRDGLQAAPAGARLTRDACEPPSAAQPTVGQPTRRVVGRLPEENTRENTFQPANPVGESAVEPTASEGTGPVSEPEAGDAKAPLEAPGKRATAEALLLSLGRIDPRLAMPARTARSWAPLAAKWLDSGLSPLRIRQALTAGMADARKPLGALRWRLEHALPDVPPLSAPAPAAPKPEPRLASMRECRTRHTQPRLFTPPPGSNEKLCPDCRLATEHPSAAGGPRPEPAEGSGYAEFLAARRGSRTRAG